jgi:RNA polymerase sigma-70 factor (ECF subfamily)
VASLSEPQPGLLDRARSGDSDAFGELVRPHLPLFHNAIFRILGDTADTQDALQEALIGMHRDLPKFEGRSRFSTWAYPICVNAALMLRRSKVRRREEPLEDSPSQEALDARPKHMEATFDWKVEAEALLHLERKEMRTLMLKALDEMPDSQRIVFILRDLEDWDTDRIAAHLGVTPAVVRQRLHRARTYLEGRLRALVHGRAGC